MKKTWLFLAPTPPGDPVHRAYQMFAFDVYNSGSSLGEELLSFLIHLMPAYALLALLFIA